MGERDVTITLPAPAKPYFMPKKEATIKAMFKTELPRTYFRLFLLKTIGSLKKYKIGKKERLIRKKRQKMMISIGILSVRIFSAVHPPPQRSMAKTKSHW